MNTNLANNPPAPPSIMTALRAGFDAITTQVGILIFPITIDVLIWLGPHIRLKELILNFFQNLFQYPGWRDSSSYELFELNIEFINELSDRINMMVLLRTYPVGIPSLMAGRQPIATPVNEPISWGVTSMGSVLLIGIILVFIGLAAGTLYYQLIAQIAIKEKLNWRQAIEAFPRAFSQIIILVLSLLGLVALISIPAGCILSLLAVVGLSIGQFMIFLLIGLLIWILFPLIMTPQAIIIQKKNVLNALKNSLSITRMTLPTTGMLFAVIFLISEGLDILWRIPGEDSWLTFLGIFGHAFITTSLLTATFIYYRDAENWVQGIYKKILLSSEAKKG
jgi:hypothetical protein